MRLPSMGLLTAALWVTSAGAETPHPGHAPPPHRTPAATSAEAILDRVARVHGEAGPWAVAGYRMAEHAAKRLGLTLPTHDLEVEHQSPRATQYACIADGAQAATGVSVGKLNL